MKTIISVSVFLVVLQVDAYKILGVFPTPSFSHFVLGSRLMKALAEKGHEIVIISPYKEAKPLKNYREIVLEEVLKKSEGKQFNTERIKRYKITGKSEFV